MPIYPAPLCTRHYSWHSEMELTHFLQPSKVVLKMKKWRLKKRKVKKFARSLSSHVVKPGYITDELPSPFPWPHSTQVPTLEQQRVGLCSYLITLSWTLIFSCDMFMRRSGNSMSTKKARSLGSQPISKRWSRAVWTQDKAGSRDLKRPHRWQLPKLPTANRDSESWQPDLVLICKAGFYTNILWSLGKKQKPKNLVTNSERWKVSLEHLTVREWAVKPCTDEWQH